MPRGDDYDDEEDDSDDEEDDFEDEEDDAGEDNSFDIFKILGDPSKFYSDPNKFFIDPNKLFSSKQFRQLFNDIFEKITKNLPPEFQNLSPEDLMREFRKNKSKFGLNSPIMYGFNINIDKD
ncbi:MAG: hypothetical protein ACFFCI_21555, partial [Promethearchaeota archaeon]